MVALNKHKSVDDLDVGSVNLSLASPTRRARSSSPVKSMNRLSMPPLPSRHLADSNDDLLSTFSVNSSISTNFRELSRSPISKKLHISRADLAIPIPFTLQLPPKLSKSLPTTPRTSTSPQLSPKSTPSKLVFNGSSYEAMEFDEVDSADVSYSGPRSNPGSPSIAKPPSVTASRKKVAKFVQKTNSIPLDQLSMIEEASTRANSVKSKALTLLPVSPLPSSHSLSRRLLRKPPPDMEPVLEAPVANRVISGVNSNSINAKLLADSAGSSVLSAQPSPVESAFELTKTSIQPETNEIVEIMRLLGTSRVHEYSKSSASGSPEEELAPPLVAERHDARLGLSHTTAFHHNLNNTTTELRIDKRTFSDESHVSSVSSFSSVGDYFNTYPFNYSPRADFRDSLLHLAQRNQPVPQTQRIQAVLAISKQQPVQSRQSLIPPPQVDLSRNVSTKSYTSESSEGSHSSWNSLQKSLDLTLKESLSNTSDIEDTTLNQVVLTPLEVDETMEIEILPLNIVKSGQESLEKPEVDASNNGAGRSFNFPNNESNITNTASKKKAPNSFKNSHSAYSLMSSTGQIEIPDLDDLSIQEKYSQTVRVNGSISSGTESASDIIEPIGMPSRAARDHFKSIYGEHSSDSDSDSSFNSQFTKLNKKRSSKLSPIEESVSTPVLQASPAKSPVRHARQRSMYNIDFEGFNSEASPIRKHSRSRSTADVSIVSKELPPTPQTRMNLANDEILGSSPKIVVAEPPKKVQYAVDFKTATKVPQKEDMFHIKAPLNYYQGSSLSATNRSSHSEYLTAGGSDIASSYQSSRTARETMSTAPTDNNSVLIDLTKDSYNLCMITRKDSQLSYKSVIEKTKDGKDVEVVLVDEDDDTNNMDLGNDIDRDDLLSIYSHYMNDWVVRSDFKRSDLARADFKRSDSMLSSASEASDMTTSSWTPTETNFHVKSVIATRREREPISLRGARAALAGRNLAKNVEAPQGKRLPVNSVVTKTKPRIELRESNYYDYSAGENYDFKTFMEKRAISEAN
ncbi:CIC11C00000001040 [Sungouiella intermedia]|uniref:CIC11C00000001040 n=1 Tax=Sungouiella intermedia TaxID=45354 RepID=A0A1L0BSD1_9ASCO|nr:CIC11C00000001040 [[Candida] intermedia]